MKVQTFQTLVLLCFSLTFYGFALLIEAKFPSILFTTVAIALVAISVFFSPSKIK